MIALDDFQLTMAIHTGQYASFDTIHRKTPYKYVSERDLYLYRTYKMRLTV